MLQKTLIELADLQQQAESKKLHPIVTQIIEIHKQLMIAVASNPNRVLTLLMNALENIPVIYPSSKKRTVAKSLSGLFFKAQNTSKHIRVVWETYRKILKSAISSQLIVGNSEAESCVLMNENLLENISNYLQDQDFINLMVSCKFFNSSLSRQAVQRVIKRNAIKQVAVGNGFLVILKLNGDVLVHGRNDYSQLGDGSNDDMPDFRKLPLPKIIQVAAHSYDFSAFLCSDGKCYAVGFNKYGQLGIGKSSSIPLYIPQLCNLVKISTCNHHALFLDREGRTFACGLNDCGQLGVGDQVNRNEPTLVLLNKKIIQAEAGFYHSIFLIDGGDIFMSGDNSKSACGLDTTDKILTPKYALSGVAFVAAGYHQTSFLMLDGTVNVCGLNNYGQLGIRSSESIRRPEKLPLKNIQKIAIGIYYQLFLDGAGNVYGCGLNNKGQLGTGDEINYEEPTLIQEITDVQEIFVGFDASFFVCKNYEVWFCGSFGSEKAYRPRPIKALNNWKKEGPLKEK